MFGKLKNMFGAKDAAVMILAPVEGEVVPVTQVSDPTFGEEILGKGVAIKPERGRVVAPVSGEISLMFDTGHAVSIVSDDGAEVLVHVGLDTVSLKGQFYTAHVKTWMESAGQAIRLSRPSSSATPPTFPKLKPLQASTPANWRS